LGYKRWKIQDDTRAHIFGIELKALILTIWILWDHHHPLHYLVLQIETWLLYPTQTVCCCVCIYYALMLGPLLPLAEADMGVIAMGPLFNH
jgi:hypothetical protein